jgi:hypothetical protein
MPEPRPTQGAPRVVVLSKPHPLTTYLVARLADEGVLTGVLHEERFLGFRDRVKYLRSNVRREGFWHTVDAVAYELFDRVTRRDRLNVVAARVVGAALSGGRWAGAARVVVSMRQSWPVRPVTQAAPSGAKAISMGSLTTSGPATVSMPKPAGRFTSARPAEENVRAATTAARM